MNSAKNSSAVGWRERFSKDRKLSFASIAYCIIPPASLTSICCERAVDRTLFDLKCCRSARNEVSKSLRRGRTRPADALQTRSSGTSESQSPGAWIWLPVAAAIVIAIGAGIYVARLQRQISDLQTRFDQAQAMTAVLAAPDLARIDLQGQATAPDARARALWSRSRGLVFTAANLPPAPAGKAYQVWVVTAQAPISAGLLLLDPGGVGTQFYTTPPDIPPPVAVAVTLEPAGGVPAPTGDRYLVGMP